jgi:hypothetical protein
MKAITLYQPWASLVAMGKKKIETRSWSTKYRGPLAIHAGMNHKNMKLIAEHPFSDVFGDVINRFPFGQVIAVCRLVDCIQVPLDGSNKLKYWASVISLFPPLTSAFKNVCIPPGYPELEFGDYTPGRFAWILDEVEMLPEPISAKGMLGLWNWEMPEVNSPVVGQRATAQGTRKGARYGG